MNMKPLLTLSALLLVGAGADPSPKYWILQGPRLDASAMASSPDAVRFLSQPGRIVIYPVIAAMPAPSSWHVILWRKFGSLAAFREALDRGKVGDGVQIVGYDPEKWQFTPDDEQADPAGSMIAFAKLAHQHGYKVIVTPAENLMLRNSPGQNKFQAFLASGIAKQVAPFVDFYHIQAQGLQHNIDGPEPSYRSFVRDMIAQIHEANPNCIVTVGISTNTPGAGGPTSPQDIAAAVRAVDPMVSGYWMNVVHDDSQTAVDALKLIDSTPPQ
jgi:hypothetical protein